MKQATIITKFLLILLISGVLLACGTDENDNDTGGDGSNQPPTISGTPTTTVNEGNLYHFAPMAADSDSGDTLTFSINNKPAWASFDNQTGILNGTPGLNDAADYDNIIISVSDGTATAELAAFMISVVDTNQPPTITGMPATTINGNSLYHFAPTAADSDSGDTLTFTISNKPSWANFDNQTGVLTGTPGLSDAGDYDNIIISVSDGTATAELAAFMISVVNNTNQPPTITGTPAITVNEDSPYHFAPTAADADSGDTLTFAISNKPAWANFDNQTGVLNGTPGLSDVGDYDNIIISVSDGTATAELAAFMISVVNTNQPPTITGTPATTVNEDSPYHFAPTAADADSGDTLTFAISNQPSWANFDDLTGVLSGTPGLNDAGDYSNIIISVSDGTATAELAAFTISVIETGLAPGVTLSWLSPVSREDSTALTMSEISGYRIYYGTDPTNLAVLAVITDNSVTQYTTAPLDANTYYFAVTTYDIDGTESAFSNIESKTLP